MIAYYKKVGRPCELRRDFTILLCCLTQGSHLATDLILSCQLYFGTVPTHPRGLRRASAAPFDCLMPLFNMQVQSPPDSCRGRSFWLEFDVTIGC
mmetsp:Transcript_8426/g.19173  ORF Transcript_8426/g.19173 Transcript_8426/m.19173 type:complete len:95 (+) Transcript_8426:934-1218(+)